VQPAPSIASKNPPASVPESAASSLSALQNAAEGGHPVAQWKLGRMYADGDGVVQENLGHVWTAPAKEEEDELPVAIHQ